MARRTCNQGMANLDAAGCLGGWQAYWRQPGRTSCRLLELLQPSVADVADAAGQQSREQQIEQRYQNQDQHQQAIDDQCAALQAGYLQLLRGTGQAVQTVRHEEAQVEVTEQNQQQQAVEQRNQQAQQSTDAEPQPGSQIILACA